MILFLLLLITTRSLDSSDYLLVYSSETSTSLLTNLEKTLGPCQKLNISEKTASLLDLMLKSPSSPVLLDLTENIENFAILDEICEQFETVYLSLTQNSDSSYSKFRFFLRSSFEVEKNSINELIYYLGWTFFSIFSTSSQNDLQMASSVKSEFSSQIKYFLTMTESTSEDFFEKVTKKCIKASGIRKILFLGKGNSLKSLQKNIQKQKLELPGSHFLFSPDGSPSAYLNGSVLLTYPGAEESKTEEDLKVAIILNLLNLAEGKSLKSFVEGYCEGHFCTKELLVVNIQEGRRVKVGTIGEKLSITETVVFPGNTFLKEASLGSTPIVVSIANGTSEPNMNVTDETYASGYKGAEYAVNRSNLLSEIPNFHLELFPTDCGNGYFDFSLYLKCFSQIQDRMGIAYLTSISSVGTMGNYLTLKAMQKTIPQLAPMSLIEALNDKIKYPELLKLGMSNFDYGESFLLFMLSFKWDSIIFFGSYDEAYQLQYLEYLNILNSINITIVNPVNLRLFPANFTRKDLNDYKEFFEFAKNSKCRIYLLATPYSAYILEGLYDVGLRKEDVIAFGGFSMYYSINFTEDPELLMKIHEFHKGLNFFAYQEWVGDYGQKIYNEMASVYSFELTHLCITFDAISVIKASIQHLLDLGEDYELQEVLLKSMRLQRVVGCMGTIYFLSDSNAVATFRVNIGQLIYDSTTSQYSISYYVSMNKYDSQIIKYSKSVEWPDGSEKAPSNFIDFGKCEVDQRKVRNSDKARRVVIALAVVLTVVAGLAAFLATRFFEKNFQLLENGKEVDIGDYIVFGYIVVHTVQLLALDNNELILSSPLIKLLGMNWVSLYDFQFFKFWKLYELNLWFVYVYIVLVLLFLKANESCIQRYFLLSKLKDIADILLPLYGHLLFIPVTSNLMNIFMCSRSIGERLEDSYLDRDCHSFCFTGKHFKYSAAGGVGLFLYIFISTIIRPVWENQLINLNIKVKTSFYSILSVFQVIFVMTNAVLGMFNKNFVGFTAAILVLGLVIISWLYKPMNYERANISLITFLFVAFWCILLSSIYPYASNGLVVVIFYFVGIGVIFISGAFFSAKAPRIFLLSKKKSMAKLFQKHFRSGSSVNYEDDNESNPEDEKKNDYLQGDGLVKKLENAVSQLDRSSGATVITSQAAEIRDNTRIENF